MEKNVETSARTDLAYEHSQKNMVGKGIKSAKRTVFGVPVTGITIDETGENLYQKLRGNYYTLFTGENAIDEEKALTECLKSILPSGKALVIGLGNRNITPDSLGVKAAAKVLATAHLKEADAFQQLDLREVFVLGTGVLAQTGFESATHVKAVCAQLNPDFVIAIDALACSDMDRLCRTIQLTDTGISPGSGVGNNRKEISRKALGIPCYAIGVPTVIDMESVVPNAKGSMMITPRNIDEEVIYYSTLIANAISSALNPNLEKHEIEQLKLMQ